MKDNGAVMIPGSGETAPAAKPKRMRASDRRQQILFTAALVFAQENYENATTAKIAAAAGITEPTIYMHFKSKKELFCAILEESYAFIMAIIKDLWDTPGDLYTRYRGAVKSLNKLMANRSHIDLAKIWIIASTVNDPDIRSYVSRFDKNLMAFIAQDMKKAAKLENITLKYKPEVFGRIFISLVINATTLNLSGSKISKKELDGVLDLLLNSLIDRPA